MEINELKDAMGSLSAPQHLYFKESRQMEKKPNLIDQLRKEDTKSKGMIRRFYITYFIIAAFYFGLFILNPDQDLTLNDRINGTLFFIGIMLFAMMGKMKYTKLKKIRYDEPSRIFLRKALARYKFWSKETNYAVLLVLIINIGSCRSYVNNYPIVESQVMNVIIFELFFIFAIGIAIYFGYRHWSAHKRPMANEIRNLLQEME